VRAWNHLLRSPASWLCGRFAHICWSPEPAFSHSAMSDGCSLEAPHGQTHRRKAGRASDAARERSPFVIGELWAFVSS
jgi:hypothetical protein